MELSLQVQQKQILSQKMQQSVEILQMNAVTLSEYIREFAEENSIVEWNEEKEPMQQENTELLQKLEWLEEADEQNRSLYRMEHEQEEKERETNAFGRKEGQSLREFRQDIRLFCGFWRRVLPKAAIWKRMPSK